VLKGVSYQGIELLLRREDDGKWRVVQERVLKPLETVQDGLVPQ
jgi:ketosteroid isomerase-like protein